MGEGRCPKVVRRGDTAKVLGQEDQLPEDNQEQGGCQRRADPARPREPCTGAAHHPETEEKTGDLYE